MKRLLLSFVFVLFLLPACRAQEVPQGQRAQSVPPIEVYFSPKGGCTDAKVKPIRPACNMSTKRSSGRRLQELPPVANRSISGRFFEE